MSHPSKNGPGGFLLPPTPSQPLFKQSIIGASLIGASALSGCVTHEDYIPEAGVMSSGEEAGVQMGGQWLDPPMVPPPREDMEIIGPMPPPPEDMGIPEDMEPPVDMAIEDFELPPMPPPDEDQGPRPDMEVPPMPPPPMPPPDEG